MALKYGSTKTEFKGVNAFAPVGDYTYANNPPPTRPRHRFWLYHHIYAYETACPKCMGTGLGEAASHTTVGGMTIAELEGMYIRDLRDFFEHSPDLPGKQMTEEILQKLTCMDEVGLYHLALSRPIPTLSGGEIQRLFLASYIIAEMDSIIFVFDEPTIGLHEVEKNRLISIIKNLILK